MNYTQQQAIEDAKLIKKYVGKARNDTNYYYLAQTATAGAIERLNGYLKSVAKSKGGKAPVWNFEGYMRNSTSLDLLISKEQTV